MLRGNTTDFIALAARGSHRVVRPGQTILISFGHSRVQRDGGPVEEVRQGDVVEFPAGARHWQGAAPDTAMIHIAIHNSVEGTPVTWLEQVTDADYNG